MASDFKAQGLRVLNEVTWMLALCTRAPEPIPGVAGSVGGTSPSKIAISDSGHSFSLGLTGFRLHSSQPGVVRIGLSGFGLRDVGLRILFLQAVVEVAIVLAEDIDRTSSIRSCSEFLGINLKLLDPP